MTPSQLQNQAKVFLVEDSQSDIVLTKAMMKTRRIHFHMDVFRDGSEIISFLENATDDKYPDLILLDYNLPKVSGAQVLEFLRSAPTLAHIPVVICSGSEADDDLSNALQLGASAYMVKPLDEHKLEDATSVISTLEFVQIDNGWLLQSTESVAAH